MFRLNELSSGQIQNIVPVHSVTAHYGIQYCLQNCTDIKDHLLADVLNFNTILTKNTDRPSYIF